MTRWTIANREFLRSVHSTLEFDLHRSRYLSLLFNSNSPDTLMSDPIPSLPSSSATTPAHTYARLHFPSLYQTHPQCTAQLHRLMALLMFAQNPAAVKSFKAYADLADPQLRSHEGLEKTFVDEWCRWMGVGSRDALREVADLGGNGALARIEKGRKVMAGRKAQGGAGQNNVDDDWWDSKEELMVSIDRCTISCIAAT